MSGIIKLDKSNLVKLLDNTEKLFLFMDSDYFEESSTEVKEIDNHVQIEYLWEDTLWDDFKHDGPILVGLGEHSPLITTFREDWAKENRGIIIQSKEGIKNLFQHLQSLMFIENFDNTLRRLRIYEPRKLTGIIEALMIDEKQKKFMGPIQRLIWQENCGKESQWLKTKNPEPEKSKHNVTNEHWFSFSKKETEIITKNEVRYFFRNLAWQLSDDFDLDIEDAQKKSEELTREARKLGFLENNDMEKYVLLRMQYGDFRDNHTVQKHIQNTEYKPGGRLTQIQVFLDSTLGASGESKNGSM